jgi:predicted dehydrogenase/threonine dehydrogenase-like Zn-dependent dehydrogenase
MKQLLQSLSDGKIEIADVPCPQVKAGHLTVCTSISLISPGTERIALEFGRASLIDKARNQPEKVKLVLKKMVTEGISTTVNKIKTSLEEPHPLGYSNVGVVIDIGKNVAGYSIGDRVVSNGNHAEIVIVPKNLTAKIPHNVDDEAASFTILGSIALQGIRLINPSLGDYICVIGLGVVGQLTVQLLSASGCKVLGIDIDEEKVRTSKNFGADGFVLKPGESPVEIAKGFSMGRGVDGVIITASTKSNEPIEYAAQMCRKRGKIVLVGVTGTNISRSLFYEKELTFQVSCSYGPGRYDKDYEEKGLDYPIEYVRWTEQRNFEAVLDMMSVGKIKVKPLINHRVPFREAEKAYNIILQENPLGVVLHYGEETAQNVNTIQLSCDEQNVSSAKPVVGVIGVGGFAKMTLLPCLKDTDAYLKTIASSRGFSGLHTGKKYGFKYVTSEYSNVLEDQDINTVVITTRHDSHASLVVAAMERGKNVFVEKPLALNIDELKNIISVYKKYNNIMLVGFNRRFSRFTEKLKEALSDRENPICVSIMVNAGKVPSDHWVCDHDIGGGRIIGEGCHFIDLLRFIVGSKIMEIYALSTKGHCNSDEDKMTINLKHEDGSIGTIHYFANGSKSYPKEKIEVFSEGKVFVINNFKSLSGYSSNQKLKSFKQDKGHLNEMKKFINAVSEGSHSPIPFEELIEVTLSSFAAVKSAEISEPIKLESLYKEVLV